MAEKGVPPRAILMGMSQMDSSGWLNGCLLGGITAPRGSEKIDLALVSSSYRSPQKTRQHRRGP